MEMRASQVIKGAMGGGARRKKGEREGRERETQGEREGRERETYTIK